MSSEQLQRTTYRDPISGAIRTDESSPSESESAQDMDQYYLPLARVHGSGLHGWGVASGLSVTATLADPTTGTLPALNVSPGIALDSAGQHISLALGGVAETTTDLDINGNPATSVPAEVTTSGAFILPTSVLPSSVLPGTFSLTIQFWEWFEGDIDPSSTDFYSYVHFPWLRLLATPPTDGSVIILATVTLDASGNITALTRDPGLGVFLPAESIQLSRAVNTAGPNFSVNSTLSGTISSHPAGGILLRGQNTGDDIYFVRNDGSDSITVEADFGTLAVGAAGVPGMIAVSDWTAPAIFLSGDEATIRVGRASNYGEVDVYDASDNLAVASNGAQALITVGGTNNPGVIRTFDAGRNTTVRIEAATGVARLKRLAAIDTTSNAIDVDALFFQIHAWDLRLDGRSGGNKRALVDGNNKLIINYSGDYGQGVEVQSDLAVDGNLTFGGILSGSDGVPLMGNPARKVAINWLFVDVGVGSYTTTIDLGSPRVFTAFGCLLMLNSTVNFDYDNAGFVDIYQVDGAETPSWITGAGSNFGGPGDPRNMHSPSYQGTGQLITFRIWATGPDLEAAGLAIVFYE